MQKWAIHFLLLLMALLLPLCAFAEFAIHFLDVGQGDAALVLCDGESLLIDGGDSGQSQFLYSYLTNTLQLSHIDTIFASHPHSDHIGGLPAVYNACSVGVLYSPVALDDPRIPVQRAVTSLVKYADAPVIPSDGDSFAVGSAKVTFLHTSTTSDSINNWSMIVRIEYGATSFLFTADAEVEEEKELLESGFDISATVLKVGHHGSITSSSTEFLEQVHPAIAIISVGPDNGYGHPAAAVLERLNNLGAEIFRTDLLGTLICTSDGQQITILPLSETFYSGSYSDVPTEEPATMTDLDTPESTDPPESGGYIGNSRSKCFHLPSCSGVASMNPNNRVFFATRDDAINAGYTACGFCAP